MASSMTRWGGGLAGFLAGVCYIGQAVMTLAQPQGTVYTTRGDYIVEAIFVAGLLLTLVALVALRARQEGRDGRLGTVGFWPSLGGTALVLTSASASLVAGQNVLGLAFLAGLLLSLGGNIVLGLATLRAGVLPRWCGFALIVGLPVSVVGSAIGGGIVLGLVWLLVGWVLWSRRHRAERAEVPRVATS